MEFIVQRLSSMWLQESNPNNVMSNMSKVRCLRTVVSRGLMSQVSSHRVIAEHFD